MLIEVILNAGTFLAICLFTRSILISASSTRSQRTLALFLLTLAFHLLFKGLAWIWPTHPDLMGITYAAASFLPLLLALHIESLLRRHLARAFKYYLVVGTVVISVCSIVFARDTHRAVFQSFFIVYTVGFAFYMSWLLFSRDESDLLPSENALLNATTVGFVVLFCFLISELPIFYPIQIVRAGSLGGLIFLYICIRLYGINEGKREIFGKLLQVTTTCFVFAVIACLGLFEDLPYRSLTRMWCLSMMGFLGYLIYEHLQRNNLSRNEDIFLNWLNRAETRDLNAFLRSLKSLKTDAEVTVIGGDWLKNYRRDLLRDMFRASPFFFRRDLRKLAPSEAVDQAIDLMDEVGINAMVLVREEPLTFIGMEMAQGGGTLRAKRELGVIRKICEMLEGNAHVDAQRT